MNFLLSIFSLFSFVTGQQVCVGDIDGNGSVDVNDLLGVLTRFSESGDLNEDINDDGLVDVNDILILLSNYGQTLCNNDNNDNMICNLGQECGGQLWTDCGTSCPLICSEPEIMMCNMMCNAEYQCPSNLWWDREINNCVEQTDCTISLPPDIAIGRPYINNNKNSVSGCIDSDSDWINKFE
tara:strand:- start:172 stop:717 length:546 start_codon:yes stop_codon:yes gene_type:complete